MLRFFWNNLLIGLASLVNMLLIASIAQATEPIATSQTTDSLEPTSSLKQINQDSQNTDAFAQATSISPSSEGTQDTNAIAPGTSVSQLSTDLENTDSIEQVTSVFQLSDVQPTDWAFQALQSLVERYGCNSVLAEAIGLPTGQRKDRDIGLHIEAFYRYNLNDNISVTPGFFWLTAPNHDERNSDVVIGVVRTTFLF